MQRLIVAPLGAWTTCVKIWQDLKILSIRPKKNPLPPKGSRMARDIGLSPAQSERLHLRWPSEDVRHPYL